MSAVEQISHDDSEAVRSMVEVVLERLERFSHEERAVILDGADATARILGLEIEEPTAA